MIVSEARGQFGSTDEWEPMLLEAIITGLIETQLNENTKCVQ